MGLFEKKRSVETSNSAEDNVYGGNTAEEYLKNIGEGKIIGQFIIIYDKSFKCFWNLE